MVSTPLHKQPDYPTDSQPVPLSELGTMKCVYLADRRAHRDPTIVWGTAVDSQPMTDFLASESRHSNTLLSVAHVLICAVARSLAEHPHLNRKVIGRRIYPLKQIKIAMPLITPANKQVNPVLFENVESMSLQDIAKHLWDEARSRGAEAVEERRRDAERTPRQRYWHRIKTELKLHFVLRATNLLFFLNNQLRRPNRACNAMSNGVSALVNLLNFPAGAPPLLSLKPSSLPMNSAMVTVTMGAAEWRPTVVDGEVVARRMAPLFVKVDHRLVHMHEVAAFMNTLCRFLTEPSRLIEGTLEPVETLSTASV